ADGFIKIAVENMANAIKKISVQRGYDVTRYTLNCFGGAGGQHACLVADALGMTKVLIHPFSSLLSAYGMGLADIRATRQQAVEEPFGDASLASIARVGGRLAQDARREVVDQGVAAQAVEVFVRAHIRYAGTDTALVVPACSMPPAGAPLRPTHPGLDGLSLAEMKSAFEAAHKSRFGFVDESKELVVAAVSVEAARRGGGGWGRANRPGSQYGGRGARAPPPPRGAGVFIRGGNDRRPEFPPASSFPPPPPSAAPPSSSSRTRPSWSRTAGAPKSPPRTTWCSIASSRSSGKAPSAPPPTR